MALAHHLGQDPRCELTVAIDDPDRYAREPVARLLPIRARFVDRARGRMAHTLRREGFDILIVDNHLPAEPIAPRLLVLWHGFGWRIDDLTTMRRELAALVGDVTRPNPNFRWQACGPWDREYRIQHSGLAPDNVLMLGAAFSDLLLPQDERPARAGDAARPVTGTSPKAFPLADRAALVEAVQDAYPVDLRRKTILLGLTWHHGAAFAQWGDDSRLLGQLFDHAAARDTNVLVRMHDRRRYEPAYLEALERVARGRQNVWVTYKSEHPDSLVDFLVSDLLVSNYSSLLNGFYFTRRPTVHLDPCAPGAVRFTYRRLKRGRVHEEKLELASELWKLDPAEIGGLRATSFPEALALIGRALKQPDCCREPARVFTTRYVTGADGNTCARIADALLTWPVGPG